MLVVGTLSIALLYGIVEYTFNDEGGLNAIPLFLEKIINVFYFIFLFPWSVIEYIIKLAGTDMHYPTSIFGKILLYFGFIVNLIIQYFIFKWLWVKILKVVKRKRLNTN